MPSLTLLIKNKTSNKKSFDVFSLIFKYFKVNGNKK